MSMAWEKEHLDQLGVNPDAMEKALADHLKAAGAVDRGGCPGGLRHAELHREGEEVRACRRGRVDVGGEPRRHRECRRASPERSQRRCGPASLA